jgi:uncharacterized protein (TIGR00661 family)
MAKIIYGVAGEGSGHSMRARVVLEHLKKNGHDVKVFSHDRGFSNLKSDFDVTEIFGLKFVYEKNKVRYVKTLFRNLGKIVPAKRSLDLVTKTIDEYKPDFIFTDFEPLSAIAAGMRKVPLLSIDNQHRITNFKLQMPVGYTKDVWAAKAVIKLIAPNAKAYIVTSFFESKKKTDNTFTVSPVIRNEVYDLKPTKGKHVLVYVTSTFDGLVKKLKKLDDEFIVYGMDKDGQEDNILFKKPSNEGFLQDLASCKAIIATAGFTLMSEALYLKKPYCAIPVVGQFEQIINAFYLQKLGYGKHCRRTTVRRLRNFLANIEKYDKGLERYNKPDHNEKLLKKVDWFIKNAKMQK